MSRVHHPPFAVVEEGLARCHREPREGEHGLEGYNHNQLHRYQKVRNRDGFHMRVYPGDLDPESIYYECCGTEIFARYFEPVKETTP